MKALADTDIQAFALIHWLGVEVVQQVVRVAVPVSAHHHQGNEGGQENGGQHPNGHDHHRLHGDSGSHGGCRQQLVSWQKTKKKSPIRVGWLSELDYSWTLICRGEKNRWFQSDWVTTNRRRATLSSHLRMSLRGIWKWNATHFLASGGREYNQKRFVCL